MMMSQFAKLFSVAILTTCFSPFVHAQNQVKSIDSDWQQQQSVLKNSAEAAIEIRVGDIDNLGLGWSNKFNPFCDLQTEGIEKLKAVTTTDLPGFDRILVSSKYTANSKTVCKKDTWHTNVKLAQSKPVMFHIPCREVIGIEVNQATLQLYIYDVQAISTCSRYSLIINNERYVEGERLLNAMNLGQGIGRLINLPLNAVHCESIAEGKELTVYLDENNGSAEGFAIDFMRLLINPAKRIACSGNLNGLILDNNADNPASNVRVSHVNYPAVQTSKDGNFNFPMLATGFQFITISKEGYSDQVLGFDVMKSLSNEKVSIKLGTPSRSIPYYTKTIQVGEPFTLENIEIEVQRNTLVNGKTMALDQLAAFMRQNSGTEIEITAISLQSNEIKKNRLRSYKMAKACKDYLTHFDIDPSRMLIHEEDIENAMRSKKEGKLQIIDELIRVRFIKL